MPATLHASRWWVARFDTPSANIPYGAAYRLPVSLGLKNAGVGTGSSYTRTQARRFTVAHECLLLAWRADQALDCCGSQVDPVGQGHIVGSNSTLPKIKPQAIGLLGGFYFRGVAMQGTP